MTVCFSCGGHLLFPGALEYIAQTDYHLDYHTIYLENASDRYSTPKTDLSNDFLKSATNYPMDLLAAQTLLLNYKGAEAAPVTKQPPTTAELMFAQQAKDKAAATTSYQQKDLSEVTCNDCDRKGHYQCSKACPVRKKLKEDAEMYRSFQSKTAPGSKTTDEVVGQMDQNDNASIITRSEANSILAGQLMS